MTYPAKGGLIWGQMRECYLKLGGLHPPRGSVYHTVCWFSILKDYLLVERLVRTGFAQLQHLHLHIC